MEKEKKEELSMVFKQFDKNGDGKLSVEEVMQGYLDHYGKVISEREVHQIFKDVDFNKEGCISYTEFIISAINQEKLMTETYLKAAFNKFDSDNDKNIDCEELKIILGGEDEANQELLSELVKQMDKDGDGSISYKEFAAFMRAKCNQNCDSDNESHQ